jgi:hypothetical protein
MALNQRLCALQFTSFLADSLLHQAIFWDHKTIP